MPAVEKEVSCLELAKDNHKVSTIWSSLQSLCFPGWCACQSCEVHLSQNCCYRGFSNFSPKSCYRSLSAFQKTHLHCHLKYIGGTPESRGTPDVKTLGRAYKCTSGLLPTSVLPADGPWLITPLVLRQTQPEQDPAVPATALMAS